MCFVLPPDDAVGYDGGDWLPLPRRSFLGVAEEPSESPFGAEEATAHLEPVQSHVPRVSMTVHRQGLGDAPSRPPFPF
jgi:hypothetical protein